MQLGTALEPGTLSLALTGTDLTQKADTAMYEDDEGRLDAAEQLAEHNTHAAAEAFSVIACDGAVADDAGADHHDPGVPRNLCHGLLLTRLGSEAFPRVA